MAAVLCAAMLPYAGTAAAGTIYWGTAGRIIHRKPCGDTGACDSLRIELGVFRDGFQPTPANVPQWRENWITLSTALFDSEERRFAGIADDSLPLPAGFSNQACVWTYDDTDLAKGPQWLLLADPQWRWTGAAGNATAPARTWIADSASLAILGTVESGGTLLASAPVRPEIVPMAGWLDGFFPGQPAKAHPDADPDGDGMDNRLEYFLGTDPDDGSSLTRPEMNIGTASVRLTLGRNPHAVSTFVLETSEDLGVWKTGDVEIVTDQPDQLEVLTPKSAPGKPLFFRFQLRSAESP